MSNSVEERDEATGGLGDNGASSASAQGDGHPGEAPAAQGDPGDKTPETEAKPEGE